jgi:biopolymer transport protein ExbD
MRAAPPEVPRVKIPLTPLVDLTFLLLVYFLLTANFVTLGDKVAAFLPADHH